MVAAVEDPHLHVGQRETGQYTCTHTAFKAFLDRLDKFLWNATTEDIIDELEGFAFVFFQPFFIRRSDFKLNIGELTATTRLFLQHFPMQHRSIECFLISNLGSTLV